MDYPGLDINRELLDNVGAWCERKHQVIQYYASAYSRVLSGAKAKARFTHVYIDGYAGAGVAVKKDTNELVKGSPLLVLDVTPRYDRYVFVELKPERADILRQASSREGAASVITGDANQVLPRDVYPTIRFDRFERAFCLLDPYELDALRWETIIAAAATKAIDVLLHFPIMDINRSVITKRGEINADDAARMTRYWGDESWREVAYNTEGLLAIPGVKNKSTNDQICSAFMARLKEHGHFDFVEGPIEMRNSKKALIYDLIFASRNEKAGAIMRSAVRKFALSDASVAKRPAKVQTDMGF